MTGPIRLDDRIARLPGPGGRRLAVRLTPDALRVARSGHPWVFDRSIRSVSTEGAAGDVAIVFDDRRNVAAVALWDPTSPIRLKIVHAGGPAVIDDAFWATRVSDALRRRDPFSSRPDASRLGYRLVNGENDGVPGLVVDRYAGVVVAKVYTPAIVPHLRPILEALVVQTECDAVVYRAGRNLAAAAAHGIADGDVVAGEPPPASVLFDEHGLTFGVDVRRGQKTGFFLDQRRTRASVGQLCSRAEVLDVFAASGGFSVHAAAGGARRVHSVDLSAPTLASAEVNMRRNASIHAVRRCTHTVEVGDAFAVLRRLGDDRERFDVVVVDPPSFATRQSQVDRAMAAYARLTRLALRTVRSGGLLVQASCSSRVPADAFYRGVTATADASDVRLVELERFGHDVDHPVTFPEGAYLKSGVWRVER